MPIFFIIIIIVNPSCTKFVILLPFQACLVFLIWLKQSGYFACFIVVSEVCTDVPSLAICSDCLGDVEDIVTVFFFFLTLLFVAFNKNF